MDALLTLLAEARDRRWCVRHYCTTCGARDYREAVHANAVALVEALRSCRIDDLRREFRPFDVDDALRLLMMELAMPFGPLLGRTRTLDRELGVSEAGEYLAEMRQHAQALAEERAQRKSYESREAVAERRRVKRERRDAEQRTREEQREQRRMQAEAALDELARLEPEAALRRVLANEVGVPLYRMSREQVEALTGALTELSNVELEQLRGLVPVTRVQPLAELSKAIQRGRSVRGKDDS